MKRKTIFFLILLTILETIGVGIVIPLIAIILDEEMLKNYEIGNLYYEFVKAILPEYDTQETKQMFDHVESIWDGSEQSMQYYTYYTLFYKKFNKAFENPLMGQYLGEL